MCWLYGSRAPCRVCERIKMLELDPSKLSVTTTASASNPYLDGYCTEVTLPETSRLASNYYLRKIIFRVEETEKKAAKEEQEDRNKVFAVAGNELWNKLKRRKVVRHQESLKKMEARLIGMAVAAKVPPAHAKLFRFLAVLDLFGSVKWSNVKFPPNELMLRRMTATHLALIVGKEEYKAHKTDLLSIISRKHNLGILQHIVWITNRQNGKTTTLARFLAAMAVMSVAGGPLIYVYSTNRDRAIELINGAKRLINEVENNKEFRKKFESIGVKIGKYESNNNTGFSIRSAADNTVVNTIRARPKTADSCRGDAPHSCLFDEVGFVTGDFWYQFALPLAQVGERRIVMATTPAHSGSFFAEFTTTVQERNAASDYFFYLFNHSLICETCKENNDDSCCHRLGNIPSWKPVTGFNQIKSVVPDKRSDDFQKELMGIIKEDNTKYFPEKWINFFFRHQNQLGTVC